MIFYIDFSFIYLVTVFIILYTPKFVWLHMILFSITFKCLYIVRS